MPLTVEADMCSYSATPCKQFVLDGVSYSAYGITCRNQCGVIETIDDISCDAHLVGKLAELFNLCVLPPERFTEAVVALLP